MWQNLVKEISTKNMNVFFCHYFNLFMFLTIKLSKNVSMKLFLYFFNENIINIYVRTNNSFIKISFSKLENKKLNIFVQP